MAIYNSCKLLYKAKENQGSITKGNRSITYVVQAFFKLLDLCGSDRTPHAARTEEDYDSCNSSNQAPPRYHRGSRHFFLIPTNVGTIISSSYTALFSANEALRWLAL